jgi:Flp pilus assembly protein TadD
VKFTLRTLIACVALCAVASAIAAWMLQPQDSQGFMASGSRALKRKDFEFAAKRLTRAIELSESGNEIVSILGLRAVANNNLGKHAEVISDTTVALTMIEPPLGLLVVMREDEWGNVVWYSPEQDVALRLLRANALVARGKWDRAKQDIEKILELQPGNSHALHLKSIVQAKADAQEK